MITLLTGDNSFEIDQAIEAAIADFGGKPEKFDGVSLQLNQLPDILMGVSLFSTSRLVIIRSLSENKAIWCSFGDWLPRLSDDIWLILVEPKVDKRSSAYKALKDVAEIKECLAWTDRDLQKAEKWLTDEAAKQGIKLDTKCIQLIVQRVGTDQWQLANALDKLSYLEEINPDIINDVIDANPSENVFNLLETAVSGRVKELQQMIVIFKASEDVNRLSALIYGQVFQLMAVASASKTDDPAKDFAIHPYVVSKLAPLARKLGKTKIGEIVKIFAKCDEDMKTSRGEPWLLLEQALLRVASL